MEDIHFKNTLYVSVISLNKSVFSYRMQNILNIILSL